MLDVLFPKRCLGCGKVGAYFCTNCRNRITLIERSICPVCEKAAIDGATHPGCRTRYTIDGLTSFFGYGGIIRKAVKALKYRFVFDLASEFISLIPSCSFLFLSKLLSTKPLSSLFIPIPLHSSRLRERGFNQAEVLGRLMAAKLHVSVRTDILKRIKRTTPQVEMKKREDRLKNMEKVFIISPNILISEYPNIFLFDDVFTTGATMRSAANTLKRDGAKFIWGITIAR